MIGETGLGFEDTRLVCKTHSPILVIKECVLGLFQKGKFPLTDAEYMVQEFNKLGYWALCAKICAKDYGSFAARTRAYWASVKGIDPSRYAEASDWFNKLLSIFKVRDFAYSVDRFVTIGGAPRQHEAAKIGVSTWTQLGTREAKKVTDKDAFKLEHLTLFQATGLVWPCNLESPDCFSAPNWAGFRQR